MLRIKYTVREKGTGSWIIFFPSFQRPSSSPPVSLSLLFPFFPFHPPLFSLLRFLRLFYSFPLPKNIPLFVLSTIFFRGICAIWIHCLLLLLDRSISTRNGKWSNFDFHFNSSLLSSDYSLRLGAIWVQFFSKYIKDKAKTRENSFSILHVRSHGGPSHRVQMRQMWSNYCATFVWIKDLKTLRKLCPLVNYCCNI